MVRRRSSQVVRQIKQMVQEGRYRMTDHVLEEMDDDGVSALDVVATVVGGVLQAKQTHDPRGPRYVMRGQALDGRTLDVVCRPVGTNVRIITTYVVK